MPATDTPHTTPAGMLVAGFVVVVVIGLLVVVVVVTGLACVLYAPLPNVPVPLNVVVVGFAVLTVDAWLSVVVVVVVTFACGNTVAATTGA